MICSELQNRLLTLVDSHDLPPHVQSHLEACELCRRFFARAKVLDTELAELPVPSSEERKLAFLDSLTCDGPVIKTMPRMQSVNPERNWRILAKPLAGLAAAIAVGVGIWASIPTPTAPVAREAFRHELLARVVKLNRELVSTSKPHEQLRTMTTLTAELRSETTELAKIADPQELQSLAKMFDRVVSQGLLKKADQLTLFNSTAAERQAVLKAAREELLQTAKTANELKPMASPQARESLEQIATVAQQGQDRLEKLVIGS